jgi:nucleotide-binding universal stress UspA family protein
LNLEPHLEQVRTFAAERGRPAPVMRHEVSRDVPGLIGQEASKGYDLILLGASGSRRGVRSDLLEAVVGDAPCHVAIVKPRDGAQGPFERLLVPVDGSFSSRIALELAVRYAEGAGQQAEVTVAYVAEGEAAGGDPAPEAEHSGLRTMIALSKEGGLDKLSPVFRTTQVKTRIVVKEANARSNPILEEAASGKHDLVVLGAENRAVHHRLFFGVENERLVEESAISVVLVVPKLPGHERPPA